MCGNLFGYFSKNWAIFSKPSGHPGQYLRTNFRVFLGINYAKLKERLKVYYQIVSQS